jgi:hypothetical protein
MIGAGAGRLCSGTAAVAGQDGVSAYLTGLRAGPLKDSFPVRRKPLLHCHNCGIEFIAIRRSIVKGGRHPMAP